MSAYSGADWVQAQFKYTKPNMVMSPLGRAAADLLGELFYGIYHLDNKCIYKATWDDPICVQIIIGWHSWTTVDFDTLTRLVFLAHHMAIRVELHPATHHYMRLRFWQRGRTGDMYTRHPTLQEAVQKFEKAVTIPEVKEEA